MHFLQAGDTVPDTPLIDQDGKPISLKDFRGSAVAVTLHLHALPAAAVLPADRSAICRGAEARRRAIRRWPARCKLLSISFDPKFDRAEVLRAHAKTVGADRQVWRFATADEAIVDRLAAEFGVNVIREKDGTITHNLRTAVIDPDGHVSCRSSTTTRGPPTISSRALKNAVAAAR